MVVRPVPVEPKAFSDAELATFDPAYADDPEPPAPPLSASMFIPFFWIGYGVLMGAAFVLRSCIRGIRAINRQCEQAEERITLFGIICVLGSLVVARYAVYVATYYAGGAR